VIKEIIDQFEAYPMFPEEKKTWIEFLEQLKLKP